MVSAEVRTKLLVAFRPHAPIDDPNAFQGRLRERDKVAEAVAAPGLQVVITGERGAGKTSLANVGTTGIRRVQIFCERTATFKGLCRSIIIELNRNSLVPDLVLDASTGIVSRGQVRVDISNLTGNDLRSLLPTDAALCVIIDELDRAEDPQVHQDLAELCKNLSTYQHNVTLVLVGVADTADALLRGHASNSRHLKQIPLGRMRREELAEILRHAEQVLSIQFDPAVEARILDASDSLPYYLHLLGSHSARSAITRNSTTVGIDDYRTALAESAHDCDEALRNTYEISILSKQNSQIYRRILWAMSESENLHMTPSDIEMRANRIANNEGQSGGRGRDRPCGPPPAQIPASGITALGSHLGSWRRSALGAKDVGFSRAATTDPRAGSSVASSADDAGFAVVGCVPTRG